jgi:hypothetical protein
MALVLYISSLFMTLQSTLHRVTQKEWPPYNSIICLWTLEFARLRKLLSSENRNIMPCHKTKSCVI